MIIMQNVIQNILHKGGGNYAAGVIAGLVNQVKLLRAIICGDFFTKRRGAYLSSPRLCFNYGVLYEKSNNE